MDQKITDLFAEVGCTPRFKTSSLKGCYGSLAIGHFLANVTPPQNAAVELMNFDGAGNFKGAYTGNFGGAVVSRGFIGTYVMNPEGTGSMRYDYTDGGGFESFDFVMVDGGKELFCIYTTHAPAAPWVATSVMKKQ
jgi:hypothetical protein